MDRRFHISTVYNLFTEDSKTTNASPSAPSGAPPQFITVLSHLSEAMVVEQAD
jgi:hypothetical protein